MIDIEKMSIEELIQLHDKIIDRLNYLEERKDQQSMLSFNMGEKVAFTCRHGNEVMGVIAKFNKKTVVVVSSDGRRWKVSPGFLKKVVTQKSPLGLVKPLSR